MSAKGPGAGRPPGPAAAPSPGLALETSFAAAQVIAASSLTLPDGPWPLRYRDPVLFWDAADIWLRCPSPERVAAGVVAVMRQRHLGVLVLAPDAAVPVSQTRLRRGVVAAIRARLPSLTTVLLDPGPTWPLPPADWRGSLPLLRAGPVDPGGGPADLEALGSWLRARRAALRTRDDDPPELGPFGTLVVEVDVAGRSPAQQGWCSLLGALQAEVGPDARPGVELHLRGLVPPAGLRGGLVAAGLRPAGAKVEPLSLPASAPVQRRGAQTLPVDSALLRLAARWAAGMRWARYGDALGVDPAVAQRHLALTELWLAEACDAGAGGGPQRALRAAQRACARGGGAARAGVELVRLLLEHDLPLSPSEVVDAVPGLEIDPAWSALEVSLSALAQGRGRDAERVLTRALDLFAPAALAGQGVPPSGALDLLRQLAWLRFRLGDIAGGLVCSSRVLVHARGRRARDLANHGALLWARGDAAAGLRSLEDAALLDPDEEYVRANLEPLRAAVGAALSRQAPDPPTEGAREGASGGGPSRCAGVRVEPPPAPPNAVLPKQRSEASRRRPRRGGEGPQLTLVSLLRDEEAGSRVIPAGCLYLLAAARAAGWQGELLDRQLVGPERFHDPASLVQDLGEPGPVIGLSAMADRLPLLVASLPALREAFPDRVIIAGGPGPSCVPGPLMELAPELDAVACGEGEQTLVELLERLERLGLEGLRGCPGLWVRSEGVPVAGPARGRCLDLDRLPTPAYDLLDLTVYDAVTVITSRGCPHRCTFCDATALWGHRRVERDLSSVLAELELLSGVHGVRHVSIEDDSLLWPPQRVRTLCAELRQRLPTLTWGCLGRADALEPGLPELLAQAGCRALFLGMESGSQSVLRSIRKGLDATRALAGARLAIQALPVRAYFIWGFPEESYSDFLDTFATVGLLRSLGAEVGYSLLAPFPGTPVGRQAAAGLRFHDDLDVPCLFHPSDTGLELDLVRTHPRVFPFFYAAATPRWQDKLRFVQRTWRHDLRHPRARP